MHWTYQSFEEHSDLEQGDILAFTPQISAILAQVHPHFCASKYLGFSVATQSCDLVRRASQPKARYITLATIRSLKDVLPQLLELIGKPITDGVFRHSARDEARRFLSRVFNQNEQAQGLFYLHADAAVELGEACVSFLRVTVTLRVDHYDTLLSARRGRLGSSFQSKYGWLMGNLYSRAAAPDWADQPGGEAEMEALIKLNLQEQIAGRGPTWIPDELVDSGIAAGVDFQNRVAQELLSELETHREKPPLERLQQEVLKEANTLFPDDPAVRELVAKLVKRFSKNGVIKKLLRAK